MEDKRTPREVFTKIENILKTTLGVNELVLQHSKTNDRTVKDLLTCVNRSLGEIRVEVKHLKNMTLPLIEKKINGKREIMDNEDDDIQIINDVSKSPTPTAPKRPLPAVKNAKKSVKGPSPVKAKGDIDYEPSTQGTFSTQDDLFTQDVASTQGASSTQEPLEVTESSEEDEPESQDTVDDLPLKRRTRSGGKKPRRRRSDSSEYMEEEPSRRRSRVSTGAEDALCRYCGRVVIKSTEKSCAGCMGDRTVTIESVKKRVKLLTNVADCLSKYTGSLNSASTELVAALQRGLTAVHNDLCTLEGRNANKMSVVVKRSSKADTETAGDLRRTSAVGWRNSTNTGSRKSTEESKKPSINSQKINVNARRSSVSQSSTTSPKKDTGKDQSRVEDPSKNSLMPGPSILSNVTKRKNHYTDDEYPPGTSSQALKKHTRLSGASTNSVQKKSPVKVSSQSASFGATSAKDGSAGAIGTTVGQKKSPIKINRHNDSPGPSVAKNDFSGSRSPYKRVSVNTPQSGPSGTPKKAKVEQDVKNTLGTVPSTSQDIRRSSRGSSSFVPMRLCSTCQDFTFGADMCKKCKQRQAQIENKKRKDNYIKRNKKLEKEALKQLQEEEEQPQEEE
ncbi:unnamed protein product [Bursaphelenchus okinawaensis]|uniref:Uncharacterized protein n=1 Tax=Bursaphelenchus okinawaensis TaxID=465554 RepID=A0A811K945_9BILA|nr:unnamed protein product [Bursaphelenchus okinawaensis]CAG9095463.1 unnamed protein product [Bursaphelenchus okinawaensis]